MKTPVFILDNGGIYWYLNPEVLEKSDPEPTRETQETKTEFERFVERSFQVKVNKHTVILSKSGIFYRRVDSRIHFVAHKSHYHESP
jgi:hypothetical protein